MGLALLAWLSGRRVVAIQVDHGLRPESPAEGPFVAAQLARFSIPVIQKRVRIEPGPNLEERARIARMAVLGDCATAHTLDDQAETLLAIGTAEEFNTLNDIAPLVRASHLQGNAVAAVHLAEIICL